MQIAELIARVRTRGVKESTREIDQLAPAAGRAGGGLRRLGNDADRTAGRLSALQRVVQGIKGAFLAFSVGYFGNEILKATINFERMNNAMRAATGNATLAAYNMRYLRNEAERLGLDLVTSGNSFAKLAAAARGTALQGQGVRDVFTAVAEASTVMGLSAEQTEGALRALEQMISKGNVQAEELRGQLGERIPGAFQIAARAMGVTTAELNEMLKKGQVLAEDMLPKFAAELRKTFGPEVTRAAQSTQAQINRFKTGLFDLYVAIGQTGVIQIFTNMLSGMVKIMRELIDWTSNLREAVMDLNRTIANLIDFWSDIPTEGKLVVGVLLLLVATLTGPVYVAFGVVAAAAVALISNWHLLQASAANMAATVVEATTRMGAEVYLVIYRMLLASADLTAGFTQMAANVLFAFAKVSAGIRDAANVFPEFVQRATGIKDVADVSAKAADTFAASAMAVTAFGDTMATGQEEMAHRYGAAAYKTLMSGRELAANLREVAQDHINAEVDRMQAMRDAGSISDALARELEALGRASGSAGEAAGKQSKAEEKRAKAMQDSLDLAQLAAEHAEQQLKAFGASEEALSKLNREQELQREYLQAFQQYGKAYADALLALKTRELEARDALELRNTALEEAKQRITDMQGAMEALSRTTLPRGWTSEMGDLDRAIRAAEDALKKLVPGTYEYEKAQKAVRAATAAFREELDELTKAQEANARAASAAVELRILGIERETRALGLRGRALIQFQREQAIREEINSTLADLTPYAGETPEEFERRWVETAGRVRDAMLSMFAAEDWQYVFEPAYEALDEIGEMAKDVAFKIIRGYKIDFGALWEDILDMFVKMCIEMVSRWIMSQRLMQAESARTGAVNSAATSGGGGGGGGGMWTSLLRMFGGSGGGAAAGTAAGASTGLTGSGALVQGTAGSLGAGTAAAAGGMSAWMVVGMYAALAVAVVWATREWEKRKIGKKWTAFQYDDTDGKLPTSVPGYENRGGRLVPRTDAWSQTSRAVWHAITDGLNTLLDTVHGAVLRDLPRIDIRFRKDGKRISTYVGGILIGTFKEVEDAIQAAIVWAFREADLGNVSQIIINALRNSTATTVEELQRDLAVAQEIVDLGLSVWERKLREHQQRIEAMRREALRLDLDNMRSPRPGHGATPPGSGDPFYPTTGSGSDLEAFGKAVKQAAEDLTAAQRIDEEYRRGLRQLRDEAMGALGDITGETRAKVQNIADALSFLRDNMELLEISTADLERVTRSTAERLTLDLASALNEYVQDDATRRMLEDATYKIRIAQLRLEFEMVKTLGVLTQEQIALIEGLFGRLPESAPGTGNRGGGGVGNTRASDRENLRNTLAEHDWRMSLRGLSDYAITMAEASKRWDEAIKLAHGDARAIAEVARARREEIAAIRSARILDVYAEIRQFEGSPAENINAIREEADQLRKSVIELGMGSDRTARALGRIAQAEQQRLDAIEMDVVGALYGYLSDSKEHEEEIRNLKLAQLDAEFEAYRIQLAALGAWDKWAVLWGLALEAGRRAITNPPVTETGGGGYDSGWGSGGADSVIDQIAEDRKRWEEEIKQWERVGIDPLLLEFRDLTETFGRLEAEARRLGMSEQKVGELRARAFADFWQRTLEPLRQLRSSLDLSEMSTLTSEERVGAARSQMDALAARARGGDFSAFAALSEAAQTYLRELRSFHGSGSAFGAGYEGYDEGYQDVKDLLEEILGNNVSAFNPSSGKMELTIDVDSIVDAQHDASSQSHSDAAAIIEAIHRLKDSVDENSSLMRGVISSYGAAGGRG